MSDKPYSILTNAIYKAYINQGLGVEGEPTVSALVKKGFARLCGDSENVFRLTLAGWREAEKHVTGEEREHAHLMVRSLKSLLAHRHEGVWRMAFRQGVFGTPFPVDSAKGLTLLEAIAAAELPPVHPFGGALEVLACPVGIECVVGLRQTEDGWAYFGDYEPLVNEDAA